MRLVKRISLAAACALVAFGCTQVKPERNVDVTGTTREAPAGALLGRVRDVVIDGYGRASFAIISYGGVMGLGFKYTAVPWATVAEMLDRNRLLVDRSNLENAPMLSSAKPEPADENWRREAEKYWNVKVAVAP